MVRAGKRLHGFIIVLHCEFIQMRFAIGYQRKGFWGFGGARGIASGSVLEFANREMLADALRGRQSF